MTYISIPRSQQSSYRCPNFIGPAYWRPYDLSCQYMWVLNGSNDFTSVLQVLQLMLMLDPISFRTEQNQLKDIKFDFVPGQGQTQRRRTVPQHHDTHFLCLQTQLIQQPKILLPLDLWMVETWWLVSASLSCSLVKSLVIQYSYYHQWLQISVKLWRTLLWRNQSFPW